MHPAAPSLAAPSYAAVLCCYVLAELSYSASGEQTRDAPAMGKAPDLVIATS